MPPRKSDVRASTPIATEETSPPAKPQQEKKEKEKEKEKDAQKAKGEDAITIEACVPCAIQRLLTSMNKHENANIAIPRT
jgi:hypothetical protein